MNQDIKFEDVRVGDVLINNGSEGIDGEMKVKHTVGCVHDGKFFFSGVSSGTDCSEHQTSWVVEKGSNFDGYGFKLVSRKGGKGRPAKVLPDKFILKYDLDRDPIEFFKTLPEAKKRLIEVMAKRDYTEDSARLFEVKKEFKITRKVSVK